MHTHNAMRGVSFGRRVVAWVSLLSGVLGVLLVGCGESKYGKEMINAPWTEMTVDYCVGSGPDVKMKTWVTKDPKVLKELQKSLKIQSIRWVTVGASMTTNRIQLKTADGNNLEMCILDENRVAFHDADHPGDAFFLVIATGFTNRLQGAIEATEAGEVHFWYRTEVNVSR